MSIDLPVLGEHSNAAMQIAELARTPRRIAHQAEVPHPSAEENRKENQV